MKGVTSAALSANDATHGHVLHMEEEEKDLYFSDWIPSECTFGCGPTRRRDFGIEGLQPYTFRGTRIEWLKT